jgi:hypothetical protein
LSSKLSRIATGNPEDVTMRTDLLMGGNDITGVGGIDASSVNVTGATNTGSLAVTGNATVAGTTQTGTLGVTGNALIGGNAGVVGTTTLNGALTVNTTSRFNGAADFREIVKLNKVVTEGSLCSDIGALARTSTGLTLSCQSGVWRGGGITSAATVIRVGNPCGCATNEIRTGCSGKQSSSYDTYAVEPNLCYGEGGPAQCICARFE